MNLWSRLGISVALASIFSIAAIVFLQNNGFYGAHKWHICLGLFTSGTILWPIGTTWNASLAQRKKASEGQGDLSSEESPNADSQPFALIDPAYWGLMLVVFSLITVFISPTASFQALRVAARTNSPSVAPPPSPSAKAAMEVAPDPVAKIKPAPPEIFKLQGLTYLLPNPSALINGRTYFAGDYVGKAKVVSIDSQRVVLEVDGSVKVLELGR